MSRKPTNPVHPDYRDWAAGLMRSVQKPDVRRMLRPMVHLAQDLLEGSILEPNRDLQRIHEGQRCFLLLTGASLNRIHLGRLGGERLFGCGRLHDPEGDQYLRHHLLARLGLLHLSREYGPKRVDLSFYVGGDPMWPLVTPRARRQEQIDHCSAADLAYRSPDCRFFFDSSYRRFLKKHRLLQGRRVHFVKSAGPMLEARRQSHDLTRRITLRDGSFPTMIAIAMYLGFKELYLCGAGYTYYPQDMSHYYDTLRFGLDWPESRRRAAIDAVREDSGTELRDVSENRDGSALALLRYRDLSPSHTVLRDYAAAHGVRIFNVVPEGFDSPVYEPVSWPEVMRRIGQPGGAQDQAAIAQVAGARA